MRSVPPALAGGSIGLDRIHPLTRVVLTSYSRARYPSRLSAYLSISLLAGKQFVSWQARIQNLFSRLNTDDWKLCCLNQTKLRQHRSLVPIDVFVRQLAVAKVDNDDQGNLDVLAGRLNARQHPVHLDRVRELENHFVNHAIDADRARDRRHRSVRRHLRNETF